MKKLLRNILILLLPIVVYYTVFVIFEPNNYFGLRAKATGTDIMATLRNYEDAPKNAVILGDSRTAKFDMPLVTSLSGTEYANLSYGGASLKEQLDILDWVLQVNPGVEQVVFGLSFYTLNNSYSHDRMVIRALKNPFAYMTNLGYNINMLTNLMDHLSGATLGGEEETMDPAAYEYVEYTDPATGRTYTLRKTIAQHLAGVAGRTDKWALNTEQLQRLLHSIESCTQKGIRFVVVFPPMHEDVLRLVVQQFSPQATLELQGALAQLHQSPALVLDYELENRPPLRDDQFYDGFHLDTQRGLDAWTEMLFCDIDAGEVRTA